MKCWPSLQRNSSLRKCAAITMISLIFTFFLEASSVPVPTEVYVNSSYVQEGSQPVPPQNVTLGALSELEEKEANVSTGQVSENERDNITLENLSKEEGRNSSELDNGGDAIQAPITVQAHLTLEKQLKSNLTLEVVDTYELTLDDLNNTNLTLNTLGNDSFTLERKVNGSLTATIADEDSNNSTLDQNNVDTKTSLIKQKNEGSQMNSSIMEKVKENNLTLSDTGVDLLIFKNQKKTISKHENNRELHDLIMEFIHPVNTGKIESETVKGRVNSSTVQIEHSTKQEDVKEKDLSQKSSQLSQKSLENVNGTGLLLKGIDMHTLADADLKSNKFPEKDKKGNQSDSNGKDTKTRSKVAEERRHDPRGVKNSEQNRSLTQDKGKDKPTAAKKERAQDEDVNTKSNRDSNQLKTKTATTNNSSSQSGTDNRSLTQNPNSDILFPKTDESLKIPGKGQEKPMLANSAIAPSIKLKKIPTTSMVKDNKQNSPSEIKEKSNKTRLATKEEINSSHSDLSKASPKTAPESNKQKELPTEKTSVTKGKDSVEKSTLELLTSQKNDSSTSINFVTKKPLLTLADKKVTKSERKENAAENHFDVTKVEARHKDIQFKNEEINLVTNDIIEDDSIPKHHGSSTKEGMEDPPKLLVSFENGTKSLSASDTEPKEEDQEKDTTQLAEEAESNEEGEEHIFYYYYDPDFQEIASSLDSEYTWYVDTSSTFAQTVDVEDNEKNGSTSGKINLGIGSKKASSPTDGINVVDIRTNTLPTDKLKNEENRKRNTISQGGKKSKSNKDIVEDAKLYKEDLDNNNTNAQALQKNSTRYLNAESIQEKNENTTSNVTDVHLEPFSSKESLGVVGDDERWPQDSGRSLNTTLVPFNKGSYVSALYDSVKTEYSNSTSAHDDDKEDLRNTNTNEMPSNKSAVDAPAPSYGNQTNTNRLNVTSTPLHRSWPDNREAFAALVNSDLRVASKGNNSENDVSPSDNTISADNHYLEGKEKQNATSPLRQYVPGAGLKDDEGTKAQNKIKPIQPRNDTNIETIGLGDDDMLVNLPFPSWTSGMTRTANQTADASQTEEIVFSSTKTERKEEVSVRLNEKKLLFSSGNNTFVSSPENGSSNITALPKLKNESSGVAVDATSANSSDNTTGDKSLDINSRKDQIKDDAKQSTQGVQNDVTTGSNNSKPEYNFVEGETNPTIAGDFSSSPTSVTGIGHTDSEFEMQMSVKNKTSISQISMFQEPDVISYEGFNSSSTTFLKENSTMNLTISKPELSGSLPVIKSDGEFDLQNSSEKNISLKEETSRVGPPQLSYSSRDSISKSSQGTSLTATNYLDNNISRSSQKTSQNATNDLENNITRSFQRTSQNATNDLDNNISRSSEGTNQKEMNDRGNTISRSSLGTSRNATNDFDNYISRSAQVTSRNATYDLDNNISTSANGKNQNATNANQTKLQENSLGIDKSTAQESSTQDGGTLQGVGPDPTTVVANSSDEIHSVLRTVGGLPYMASTDKKYVPEHTPYMIKDVNLQRPKSLDKLDSHKTSLNNNANNSNDNRTTTSTTSTTLRPGDDSNCESCAGALPPVRAQAAMSAVLTYHFGPTKERIVPFDLVLLDLAENYDNTTGMFICTIPGTYVISIYLMSHPGSKVNARIFINNRPIAALWADDTKNAGFYPSSSTQTIAQLGFGDQVYVMLVDGGYGDSWVHANYNVFTIFLLQEQIF